MDLYIGKFRLKTVDPMNITLIEKKICKDNKKENYGQEYETETGLYYQSLENALAAIPRKSLIQSEAKTVEELQADIKEIKAIVKEFCAKHDQDFKEFMENVRQAEKKPSPIVESEEEE